MQNANWIPQLQHINHLSTVGNTAQQKQTCHNTVTFEVNDTGMAMSPKNQNNASDINVNKHGTASLSCQSPTTHWSSDSSRTGLPEFY